METSFAPGMDGTEVIRSRGSDVKVANYRTVRRTSDLLLRFLAIVTTLVPVIVMGVNKETKMVPFTIFPNLPPIYVEATAKWQYLSAFVFFLVSNIIACAYAMFSLILSITNRVGSNGLELMLIVLDLVMVALLFAGNGAAAAIGLIGYKGNSHTQWNKVCNVFGHFCHHVAASIAVSLNGSLIFILLIVLATWSLHKRSP